MKRQMSCYFVSHFFGGVEMFLSKYSSRDVQIKMTFGNNYWKAIPSTRLTFIDGEIEVRVFSWPQGPIPGSLSPTTCFIPLDAADPLLSWLKMYLLRYFCSI